MVDATATLIDAGAGAGTIEIYDGTMPATPATGVTTQTLLATLTFSDPSKSSTSNGVLTFAAINSDTSAAATSTATWARVKDSNGNVIFDCDVTDGDGNGVIKLTPAAIQATSVVAITSFTLTMPSGL